MIHLRLERSVLRRGWDVWFVKENLDGSEEVAIPVELGFTALEGNTHHSPTIHLSDDHARAMVEAMVEAGITPEEMATLRGTLASTREHLADLRTLSGLEPRKDGIYLETTITGLTDPEAMP